jgi:hypothetical protein
MAGCIEDLLAYPLGDFDWLEDFNCSPCEDRFQNAIHTTSMLLLQHTYVMQHQSSSRGIPGSGAIRKSGKNCADGKQAFLV